MFVIQSERASRHVHFVVHLQTQLLVCRLWYLSLFMLSTPFRLISNIHEKRQMQERRTWLEFDWTPLSCHCNAYCCCSWCVCVVGFLLLFPYRFSLDSHESLVLMFMSGVRVDVLRCMLSSVEVKQTHFSVSSCSVEHSCSSWLCCHELFSTPADLMSFLCESVHSPDWRRKLLASSHS